MAGGHTGGERPGGDEDRGVGEDLLDLADHVAGQIDPVADQTGTPDPDDFVLVAPGERALGMGGVVGEQANPDLADGAQLAIGDQLPGSLDGARCLIVEPGRCTVRRVR